MSQFPEMRMRRTRQHDWSRRLVAENRLSVDDLILTLIVSDSVDGQEPVVSLPGVSRMDIPTIIETAKRAARLRIPAIALFPHINPKHKSARGDEALNADGLIPEAVRALKSEVSEIGVIVDVALDPFTDHGHDGVLQGDVIDNDATVDLLQQAAIILAQAGADIVAPSDMMDGRVGAIRTALDKLSFPNVMIMSYAAKFASGFYGPYRDAIGTASALRGDKRTYQMNPANSDLAVRDAAMDAQEGADMLMVKPGLPYLDIVQRLKMEIGLPTYAFQVSGEYAMIQAAAQNGWIDGPRVLLESLLSLKRAGSDGMLCYGALDVAQWLAEL